MISVNLAASLSLKMTSPWTRLSRMILLLCRDGIDGQFFVRLLVDAIAHAFVRTTHAKAIRATLNFQTKIEKPVTFTAAVKDLFADVFLPAFSSLR